MAAKSNNTTVFNASKVNDVASPSKSVKSFHGLVKSKWSFRRNKGSGKSTKKRSNSSTSSRTASIVMNDDENSKTMFLIENPSSPTTVQAGSPELEYNVGSGLDLVVLLMHPLSHRFELLQLEFDEASRAKVSDLLSQIPLSVTEVCLKDQLYDSILDQDSTDQGKPRVLKSTRLVEAFGHAGSKLMHESSASSKMVLVARPQGVSDMDALKMAKPIFANKDIANMVRTNEPSDEVFPLELKCTKLASIVSIYQCCEPLLII
jgi:hypothetical protein